MKKLLIKVDSLLSARDVEDIRDDIKKQLENDGFAVIDNRCEIYEIDCEKED